ncbi:MAG: adenylate kinase [Candidatus Zixiibacteriota bacterium]
MRLVLLGIPGSGKGSQAQLLSERLKIPWISTGDMLREEVKKNSGLGKKMDAILKSGKLVPDYIIMEVIKNKIKAPECEGGFILDGFPRTLNQTEELEKLMDDLGEKLKQVIKLDVSEKTVIQRLSGRLICSVCGADYNIDSKPPKIKEKCDLCGGKLCSRTDDQKNSILNRINIYNEKTKPIEEYYRKREKLVVINAEGDPGVVRDKILKEIEKR